MSINRIQHVVSVIALMVLAPGGGVAAEYTNAMPIARFTELYPKFSLEGEIVQNVGANWNFNLDDGDEESTLSLEAEIELAVTYKVSKNTLAYLNLQYGREMEIEEEDRERSYKPTLEIGEGYFQFTDFYKIDDFIRKSSLTVGRFKMSDEREWFYDKNLDGILVSFEVDPIDTELSVSLNREEIFGSDLLNHNDIDPVKNIIVVAEHDPFENIDLTFSAFAIVRNDRSSDKESPLIYGLSSYGKLADKRLRFWTDFALARGVDDDERIKGIGLDVGATIFLNTGLKPYITLAYAFGSGDGDEDTDFRQSDLQGNSSKFGGVTSLKYYGELLDPELSNMHILTAGIGFRYRPAASVDFVLHHYRQDVAFDKLRNTDLDTDPEGDNRDLGIELDVIWGVGLSSNIDTELVLGYFQPGSAFDDDTDDAFLVEAKLSYGF